MKSNSKLLLLFLLIISASLNGYLIFKKDPPIKKSEGTLDIETLHKMMSIRGKDIVMLGDEAILKGPWHEFFPDYPIRNRGIEGGNIQDLVKSMPPIIKGSPKLIVLYVGHHDLMDLSPEETLEQLKKLIGLITKESPRTKIILHTLLQLSASSNHMQNIVEFNRVLRKFAVSAGLPLLSLEKLSRLDLGTYTTWAKLLMPYISQMPHKRSKTKALIQKKVQDADSSLLDKFKGVSPNTTYPFRN